MSSIVDINILNLMIISNVTISRKIVWIILIILIFIFSTKPSIWTRRFDFTAWAANLFLKRNNCITFSPLNQIKLTHGHHVLSGHIGGKGGAQKEAAFKQINVWLTIGYPPFKVQTVLGGSSKSSISRSLQSINVLPSPPNPEYKIDCLFDAYLQI